MRTQQIAKMIQKELGMLFLAESPRLLDNAFASVTTVVLSSDLSLAKIYLSFALNSPLSTPKLPLAIGFQKGGHNDQEALLQKINGHKNTIRRLLGKRVAGKMHKVPNLKFLIDRSVVQGERVTALIDQLDLMER
ncbi:ribosome-binding factor A [Cardinium endosymbiont of Philonthus spinipes]|uniref:ribosome-binding factor A n=1 Tax=Cardinium endosymbiont of Philonthus spinipes TaxID=3077941 RepID=UPI00313F22EC